MSTRCFPLLPLQITVKLVTEGMDAAPVRVPVEGICGSVWNVRQQKGQMWPSKQDAEIKTCVDLYTLLSCQQMHAKSWTFPNILLNMSTWTHQWQQLHVKCVQYFKTRVEILDIRVGLRSTLKWARQFFRSQRYWDRNVFNRSVKKNKRVNDSVWIKTA